MARIADWLEGFGLERYAEVFAAQDIGLDVLPELNERDLAELGVSLGDRKRLIRAIDSLEASNAHAEPAAPRPTQADVEAPTRSDAERRQVTVMFCDMVGSTALSSRLDPEDLHTLIGRFQEACAEVVHRLEGYIGNYIGDGILVYFGYPTAHEDDPRRAVRAGLEIVEAVHALNAQGLTGNVEVAVRVGINTGLVVVGDIGSGEFRDERAVVGETPNIAARLQGLAEPGEVVIGDGTRRLVEGLFVLEEMGGHQVKGIHAPVQVYRVREESGVASRFEATANRGLTPLIARQEELGLMLSRWRQAKAGEGQVILLSGEPGIGKSRVIQGMRDAVRGEDTTVLRYFCSPFYVHTALHPILDQLERAAGLHKSDPPEVKLDKLEALLAKGTTRVQESAALLAPLLSIPIGERYSRLDLTPERQKELTLNAILEQLAGMAAKPLLLILEDAHWIDPTTAELFSGIVQQIQRMPVLLLIAFRPTYSPPWVGFPHVTSLSLNRLSHDQARALVAGVSGNRPFSPEVLEQIVARTDGVPLFVEELTKTLLESDFAGEGELRLSSLGSLPAVAMPESLQDSLMARLDRLAPVKEVAQLAATLGRVFSHELLTAVSPIPQTRLEVAIAQLVDAELVYRRGSPPDVLYEFKHALVQDAAYNSLLRSRRLELHRQIGETLETDFPETAAAKPELLAHHFREAAEPARAIPYALAAGDAAAARYASTEARARYQEALDMTRDLPASPEATKWQISAILKLAAVAANRSHYERDLANLQEALAMAKEVKDLESVCRTEYWIGRVNYVFGRFDEGVDFAERSLRMAEGLGGDDTFSADPVNLLGRLHCLRGDASKAISYSSRNVEQMRKIGNRIEEAAMLGVLAFALGQHGDFTDAFAAAERGITLARRLEHLPTQAAAVFFGGVVHGWQGDITAAGPLFEEALALCDKSGDVFRKYLTHGWRGQAHMVAEQFDAAQEDLKTCLALGDEIGTTFHRGAYQAFLAKLHLLNGEITAALRQSREALRTATDSAQPWSRSIALRVNAEALIAADPPHPAEAEQALHRAIAIQEERECRFDLAWSHLALGHVTQLKGDPEAARTAYIAGERLFTEMDIRLGRERVQAALAKLDGARSRSA